MATLEIKSSERSSQGTYDLSNKIQQNVSEEPEESTANMASDSNKSGVQNENVIKTSSRDIVLNSAPDMQPQIIYKQSRKLRKITPTKAKYYKHSIKLKTTNKSRYQRSMAKKLERYIEGNTTNSSNTMNEIDTQAISKIGSLYKMLKEIPGKESLIEDLNLPVKNMDEHNKEMSPSLCSEEAIISNISLDTVTLKGFESFENNNYLTESVIRVDEPIKTNVINVSRAQVDNTTYNNKKNTPAPTCDTFIQDLDLTSNTETLVGSDVSTPNPGSVEMIAHSSDQGAFFTSSEASVETLIEDHKKSQPCVERDSCYYQPSSNTISRSSSTFQIDISPSENYPKASASYNKKTLLDTVFNLGMFPEMTGRRSPNDYNDVIVAGRLITKFNPLTKEVIENLNKHNQNNDSNKRMLNNNITHFKPTSDINDIKPKTVKLSNEDPLNNLLKFDEKYEPSKSSDELDSGIPLNMSELWKKLNAALDAKIQKLEKSLKKKILTEMNISWCVLDKFKQLANVQEFATNNNILNTEKLINKLFNGLDKDLQCNLLDKPLKSTTTTEIALSSIFLKDSKEVQYNVNPSFEVLKPVKAAGDSEDIISIKVEKQTPVTSRPNDLNTSKLSPIWYFVRENTVVLAGAPIFIVILVCVYFTIASIVNGL